MNIIQFQNENIYLGGENYFDILLTQQNQTLVQKIEEVFSVLWNDNKSSSSSNTCALDVLNRCSLNQLQTIKLYCS